MLVDSQPAARWVGLTATPERADGRARGDVFDALVIDSVIIHRFCNNS